MRIEIYANGTDSDRGLLLHDTQSTHIKNKIENGLLTLEDSKAGGLDFDLTPEHPFYSAINRLTSFVDVYQDGNIAWSGRVLQEEIDFHNTRVIYCEGELACLNDTCQPQMEYKDSDPKDVVQALLDVHNQRVDDRRKFYLKPNHESFPTPIMEPITFTTQYGKTLDAIYNLMEKFGWHVHIERATVNGKKVRYLVFTEEGAYNKNLSQTIEFGKNLVDYTGSYDLSEMATVLIPLGQKTSSAGQTLIGDQMDWSRYYENQYYDSEGEPHPGSDEEGTNNTYAIGEIDLPSDMRSTLENKKYVFVTCRNDKGHAMYFFKYVTTGATQILGLKSASNSVSSTDCIEEKVEIPVIEGEQSGALILCVSGFMHGLTMRANAQKDVDQVFDEYTTVESVNDGSIYVMADTINMFKPELIFGAVDPSTGENVNSTDKLRSSEAIDLEVGTYTLTSTSHNTQHSVDIFFYSKDMYGGENIAGGEEIEVALDNTIRRSVDPVTGEISDTDDPSVILKPDMIKIPEGPLLVSTIQNVGAEGTVIPLQVKIFLYYLISDEYVYDKDASDALNAQTISTQRQSMIGTTLAQMKGTTVDIPRSTYFARFQFYSVAYPDVELPGNMLYDKFFVIGGYFRQAIDSATGEFVDATGSDDVIATTNAIRVGSGSFKTNDILQYPTGSAYNMWLYFYDEVYDPTTDRYVVTFDPTTTASLNSTQLTTDSVVTIPKNGLVRTTFRNSAGGPTALGDIGMYRVNSNLGYNIKFMPSETLSNRNPDNTFTIEEFRFAEFVYRRLNGTPITADDLTEIQLEKGSAAHPYESPLTPMDIYGWFERQVTWDDTQDPQVLKDRAIKYLKSGQFDKMTITIKAIDLALMNVRADAIQLGQSIRVTSKPHGLDRYFDVTKVTLNISNLPQTTYTLGYEQDFTISASSNQINETLTSLISGDTHNALIAEMKLQAVAQILGADDGGVTTVLNDEGRPIATMYSEHPPSTVYKNKWTTADKQLKCLYLNHEGIVFFPDGLEGEEPTITLVNENGLIVANAIAAGTMLADRIRGGVLSLEGYTVSDGTTTVQKYAKIDIPAPPWSSSITRLSETEYKDRYQIHDWENNEHVPAFVLQSEPGDEKIWIYDGITDWSDIEGYRNKPRWMTIEDAAIIAGDMQMRGEYQDHPGYHEWNRSNTGAIWPNFSWGDIIYDHEHQTGWPDSCGPCIAGAAAIGFASDHIFVSTDYVGNSGDSRQFHPMDGEHPRIGSFKVTGSNPGMVVVNDVSPITNTIKDGDGNDVTVVTGIDVHKIAVEFVNGFYIGDR